MEQRMNPIFDDRELPADIDLAFRPKSYSWPLALETHLLCRVKGAARRAGLEKLLESSETLSALPDLLSQSALSEIDRQGIGSVHPALMGGEYLPDLAVSEVMIARITIASTTRDVTCVYARRGKERIHYRVADEYGGDTLSRRTRRTSTRPLSLGELETFFTGAWSILGVLDRNFADAGFNVGEMLSFVVGVESEFYSQLDNLYRTRIVNWARSRRDQSATGGVMQ
jgi:hypothetical protein